jgi:hypothetical protein
LALPQPATPPVVPPLELVLPPLPEEPPELVEVLDPDPDPVPDPEPDVEPPTTPEPEPPPSSPPKVPELPLVPELLPKEPELAPPLPLPPEPDPEEQAPIAIEHPRTETRIQRFMGFKDLPSHERIRAEPPVRDHVAGQLLSSSGQRTFGACLACPLCDWVRLAADQRGPLDGFATLAEHPAELGFVLAPDAAKELRFQKVDLLVAAGERAFAQRREKDSQGATPLAIRPAPDETPPLENAHELVGRLRADEGAPRELRGGHAGMPREDAQRRILDRGETERLHDPVDPRS